MKSIKFNSLLISLLAISSAYAAPKSNESASIIEAGALYLKSDYITALKLAKDAVNKNPNSSDAYNITGLILIEMKEFAEAEINFKKSLSINSKNAEAHNNYGLLLCKIGREKEAITHFDFSEKYDKVNSERALVNAAACYVKLGDDVTAEERLQKALNVKKNYPNAKYELAHLYYRNGKFGDAQRTLTEYHHKNQTTQESLMLAILIEKALNNFDMSKRYENQLAEKINSKGSSQINIELNTINSSIANRVDNLNESREKIQALTDVEIETKKAIESKILKEQNVSNEKDKPLTSQQLNSELTNLKKENESILKSISDETGELNKLKTQANLVQKENAEVTKQNLIVKKSENDTNKNIETLSAAQKNVTKGENVQEHRAQVNQKLISNVDINAIKDESEELVKHMEVAGNALLQEHKNLKIAIEERKEAEAKLNYLKKSKNIATENLINIKSQIKEIADEAIILETQAPAENKNIFNAKTELELKKKHLYEMKTDVESLKIQLSEIKKQQEKAKTEIVKNKTSLDDGQKSLLNAKASLESAKKREHSEKVALEQIYKQIELTQLDIETSKNKTNDLKQKQVVALQSLNIIQKNAEEAQLKALESNKEVGEINDRITKAKNEMSKLNSLRTQNESDLIKLNNHLKDSTLKVDNLKKANNQNAVNKAQIENEIITLESKIKNENLEYAALSESLKSLQFVHEKAENDFKILNKSTMSSQGERESIKHNLEILEKNLEQSKSLYEKNISEINSMNKKIAATAINIDKSKELILKTNNEKELLQNQLSTLEKDLNILESKRVDSLKIIGENKKEIEKLNLSYKSLDSSLNSYENQKKKLDSELKKLTQKELDYKNSIMSLENQIKEKNTTYQNKLAQQDTLLSDKTKLSESLKEKTSALNDLVAKNKKTADDISVINDQILKSKLDLDKLNDQLKLAELSAKDAKKSVLTVGEKVDSLKLQVKEKNDEKINSEKTITALEVALVNERSSLEKTSTSLNEISVVKNKMELDLQKVREEANSLSKDKISLENKVKEIEVENQKLTQQLADDIFMIKTINQKTEELVLNIAKTSDLLAKSKVDKSSSQEKLNLIAKELDDLNKSREIELSNIKEINDKTASIVNEKNKIANTLLGEQTQKQNLEIYKSKQESIIALSREQIIKDEGAISKLKENIDELKRNRDKIAKKMEETLLVKKDLEQKRDLETATNKEKESELLLVQKEMTTVKKQLVSELDKRKRLDLEIKKENVSYQKSLALYKNETNKINDLERILTVIQQNKSQIASKIDTVDSQKHVIYQNIDNERNSLNQRHDLLQQKIQEANALKSQMNGVMRDNLNVNKQIGYIQNQREQVLNEVQQFTKHGQIKNNSNVAENKTYKSYNRFNSEKHEDNNILFK